MQSFIFLVASRRLQEGSRISKGILLLTGHGQEGVEMAEKSRK